jgi:hypothetical protein
MHYFETWLRAAQSLAAFPLLRDSREPSAGRGIRQSVGSQPDSVFSKRVALGGELPDRNPLREIRAAIWRPIGLTVAVQRLLRWKTARAMSAIPDPGAGICTIHASFNPCGLTPFPAIVNPSSEMPTASRSIHPERFKPY